MTPSRNADQPEPPPDDVLPESAMGGAADAGAHGAAIPLRPPPWPGSTGPPAPRTSPAMPPSSGATISTRSTGGRSAGWLAAEPWRGLARPTPQEAR